MATLDGLPPLREVIARHGLAARKALGQNFILDLNLTARIARAAGAALVGAGALGAYAFLVEPRWLQVTRTRIHRRGLHPALEGFRIALLTDMHAGAGTPMSVVRRACRAAVRRGCGRAPGGSAAGSRCRGGGSRSSGPRAGRRTRGARRPAGARRR